MPRKPQKDKKRPAAEDDSSVDSKGNIRNLIDYDYEESAQESEDEVFEMEETQRKPRKAAVAARRKMKKIAEKEQAATVSSSSPSPPTVNEKAKKRRIRPQLVITSDSESEESIPRPKKRLRKATAGSDSDESELPKKSKSKKSKIESDSESSDSTPPKKRKSKKKAPVESESESSVPAKKKSKKRVVEETSEEEESETESEFTTGDETSDDNETEFEGETDSEDDETETEDEKPRSRRAGTIDMIISDMLVGSTRDNKPQKYNMKKEPESVKRFVKLVQKETDEEEDNIDNDIAYFKSLTAEKQSNLLHVLEMKASPAEVQIPLKFKILEKVSVRPELNRIAMAKYNALCNLDPSSSEYYKCSHWIGGFTGIPIGIYKDLPVKLEDGPEKCFEFMGKVQKCMDSAIYGHDEAKLQIMQFVSSWIANPKANGNVLSIHGPPGVGKTSLVKDGIAKALDRPFHFISLGGATDASFLDGHSYTYEGSTWGKIVDVLIHSKCMNPVIYFDELDKVSETPKGDEIMNILIHLTDGSQNDRFQDKYFTGVDLDLSRCLFIFSHNNHEKVNPILRDRMYNIQVKGFGMKEKLLIAEEYLLPAALKEAGLHEKISINKEILQYVAENFTGGEAGVREFKRCIQTIVSKINLLRFYNNAKQVPFAIEGFSLPFTLKKSHVELFLKKKDSMDASIAHLYT